MSSEFAGVPDCFLAATRRRLQRTHEVLAEARDGADSWEAGVHASIGTLCALAARDPSSRPGFLDVAAPGLEGVALRSQAISGLADILTEGAPTTPSGDLGPHAAAAVWGAIHDQLVAGRTSSLERLAGPLSFICLAPFVGAEAAVPAPQPSAMGVAVKPARGGHLR